MSEAETQSPPAPAPAAEWAFRDESTRETLGRITLEGGRWRAFYWGYETKPWPEEGGSLFLTRQMAMDAVIDWHREHFNGARIEKHCEVAFMSTTVQSRKSGPVERVIIADTANGEIVGYIDSWEGRWQVDYRGRNRGPFRPRKAGFASLPEAKDTVSRWHAEFLIERGIVAKTEQA